MLGLTKDLVKSRFEVMSMLHVERIEASVNTYAHELDIHWL